MTRRTTFLSLLVIAAGACGPATPSSPPPSPASAGGTGAGDEAPPERPRLVVSVVFDQLASHSLEVYLPHLSEDGAIRRAAERGALHRRVAYGYAGTYTAAGHASIYTGATPVESGVFSNKLWDAERGEERAIVDDGEHAVHGVDGAFGSPSVLRAETVADVLDRGSEDAVVASVSYKDRGAIFAGGRSPDAALWYDERLPGFTSSTYYADAPPEWLVAFRKDHPLDDLLEPWTLSVPEQELEQWLGPDEAPGEGDWHGFGTVFPHDPSKSDAPYSVLRTTPRSTEYLLELAGEMVAELGMGQDDVTDLLAISISSTDYNGHVFGPHSWEYADDLIRSDRALGAFLEALEREHGPIAVLITSDHGVAPLPEHDGGESRRIYADDLAEQLDTALDEELGEGDWIAAYVQPFVYLTPDAREDGTRERVVAAATEFLERREGIERALDAADAAALRESDDPVRRLAGFSIPDDAPGDLFVVPARGWVVDEGMPRGYGTSHGTPWEYDREVPVLLWGPGVEPLETDEALEQSRVAATLSALLGIEPPEGAPDEALPGAPAVRER
ncbi:MAG: alkaline phosphatase family protein [Polyangiales bacterium]